MLDQSEEKVRARGGGGGGGGGGGEGEKWWKRDGYFSFVLELHINNRCFKINCRNEITRPSS